MTVAEALARATERLRAAGVESARREARILLEHVLRTTRARLLATAGERLAAARLADYDALVDRRVGREPLPYIVGCAPFRLLDLRVDRRALIPRPETELLVEVALRNLALWPPSRKSPSLQGSSQMNPSRPGPSERSLSEMDRAREASSKKGFSAVSPSENDPARERMEKGTLTPLSSAQPGNEEGEADAEPLPLPRANEWGEGLLAADVGTGTGAVAISLAVECPGLRVVATDLDADALALARENAARHGVLDRVIFLQGDLLEPLAEPVDLIAANLPYVATGDLGAQPELAFEPRLALDGGADGIDVYRRLVDQAPRCLRPGGTLLFEIGAGQGAAALALARRALPDAEVRVHRDLAGHDRVVEAGRRRPPP